jgi:hypothetical protein
MEVGRHWQDLEDDKNEAARFNAKAQSQAAAEAMRTKAGISEALNEEELRNAAARRATRMQQHVRDNYGSRRSEILDGYKRYHRAQALNQRNIDENILMGSSKAGLRAEADRLADWQDRSPRVYDMRTPPYGGNTLVDTYPMSQQAPTGAFMSRPIIDSLRQFGRWLNTPAIDASNAVNRVNRLRSRIPTSIGHNYIRRADVR